MKTERKRTELSGATFVFIFFYGNGNETKTPETNTKTDTVGNRYGPNTVRRRNMIQMIAEPRDFLNHAEKFKQLEQTNKLVP